MTQTTINRRRALAVVAAVPAAAALGSVPTLAGGELAALVKRYFEQVDVFNRVAVQDGRTDKQNDALARATYDKTLQRIIGAPARTSDDALAALEFLEREEMIETWAGDAEGLSESLVDAIRGYIEGRVA